MNILIVEDANKRHLTLSKCNNHLKGYSNSYMQEYVNLFNYIVEKLRDTNLAVLINNDLYSINIKKNINYLNLSVRNVGIINNILADYVPIKHDFEIDWSNDAYEINIINKKLRSKNNVK